MKNLLPVFAFAAVFSIRFVMQEFPALPPRFMYVADLVIALVAAVTIARLVATQRIAAIPLKYLLVFSGFCYVVVSAIILNDVSPAVTFAGIRNYFLYVPLFLLPFAYDYSAKDAKKQFVVVLGLALLQVPIAFRQRFFEYSDPSGDVVTGTLGFGASGILSVFLVSTTIMLVALSLGKELKFGRSLVLGLLLLLPTTINETKVTPILFGIAGCGLLYVKRRQINRMQIVGIATFAVFAGTIFVGAYDQLYPTKGGKSGYIDIVTSNPANVGFTGAQVDASAFRFARKRDQVVGLAPRLFEGESWVGRFDSLKMPFQAFFPDEMIHLLFGVGVGNVTSNFGDGGAYRFVGNLGGTKTTVTQLLWECGVLGTSFFLLFVGFVLRDSLALSTDQEWSEVATGWVGVSLIVLLVCFYLSLFMAPALLALFAFFSGLVVAKCREKRVLMMKKPQLGKLNNGESGLVVDKQRLGRSR